MSISSHYTKDNFTLSYTASVVFSVISLSLGLLFLLFGKRLIKLCSGIIGFLVVFFISLIIFFLIITNNYDGITAIVILLVCIVLGLFGVYIFTRFLKVGVCLIGFVTGCELGYMIYYFVNSKSSALFYFSIIILGFITSIITRFYINHMVIINTSMIGSQNFVRGISGLVPLPYISSVTQSDLPNYSTGLWCMFGGSIGLFFLGAIIQLYTFKRYKVIPEKINNNSNNNIELVP